jgi:hypothetical protein
MRASADTAHSCDDESGRQQLLFIES